MKIMRLKVLLKFEEVCVESRKEFAPIFSKVLESFYDKDFVLENVIISLEREKKEADKEGQVSVKQSEDIQYSKMNISPKNLTHKPTNHVIPLDTGVKVVYGSIDKDYELGEEVGIRYDGKGSSMESIPSSSLRITKLEGIPLARRNGGSGKTLGEDPRPGLVGLSHQMASMKQEAVKTYANIWIEANRFQVPRIHLRNLFPFSKIQY
eukprot:Gb_27144 [translate_table: standard]